MNCQLFGTKTGLRVSELELGTSPMAALAQLGNHGKAMTQTVEVIFFASDEAS